MCDERFQSTIFQLRVKESAKWLFFWFFFFYFLTGNLSLGSPEGFQLLEHLVRDSEL